MTTKIKISSTIIACGFFLTLFLAFKPEENNSDTVMIRVTQRNRANVSFIKIFHDGTKTEEIALDAWGNEDGNYNKITSIVSSYEKKGYKIISHSEGMLSVDCYVNTFVMTKK
jgi:hypothetical protein